MKLSATSVIALAAAATLVSPVSAHSWVEYAFRLARNGTMVGKIGFPRGYVARDSTNPPFSDSIPQNILPASGQSFYSGDEVLNKFKLNKSPEHPMLEASPGDYVAIMHLENGHTTLPQNQPNKPKNRGTIFFYGTSEPKDEEKLFDVHLVWNKEGTGGDKRGRLLATRNYDDGQCYQPNAGELSNSRATELAGQGALLEQELACQSDIKLPDDLKPGSTYTVYWYWDWPDLNTEVIDLDATSNGQFPWAGTFMRGEKDPHGFTMDAIARNESYSSVIDIKIAGVKGETLALNYAQALQWVDDQNVYSAGIKEQMQSNFQVDVDGGQGSDGGDYPPSATSEPTSTKPTDGASGPASGVTTVTVTETCSPSAVASTVYVTVPAKPAPTETTSTTTVMVTRTRVASSSSVVGEANSQSTTSTTTVMVTRTRTASSSVVTDVDTQPTASTVIKTIFTTRPKSSPAAEPTASTVIKTLTTHISSGPSATSDAAADASLQSTSTVVQTLTTHISSRPSAPAETSITYPGGQFHEAPVPASSIEATSSSSGPPIPSGFLRARNNWVFGDF